MSNAKQGPREARRAFAKAAVDLDVAGMRAALEAGADVDARVDGEHTAFMWMVESGCVEGLEELVKWGSTGAREPDARNMHSLVQAAKSGNKRVLEFILDRGADIDAVDPWGGYAVQAAAIGGRHDCLAVLLARGAKTDHRKPGDGYRSLLDFSAFRGQERSCLMLLEAGVAFDPKAVDTARAAGHGKLADALEAWRCSQMEKQELAMSTGDGVARSLGAKRV